MRQSSRSLKSDLNQQTRRISAIIAQKRCRFNSPFQYSCDIMYKIFQMPGGKPSNFTMFGWRLIDLRPTAINIIIKSGRT